MRKKGAWKKGPLKKNPWIKFSWKKGPLEKNFRKKRLEKKIPTIKVPEKAFSVKVAGARTEFSQVLFEIWYTDSN